MTLVPLPALADNYHWMLHDDFRAIGVDRGHDKPALRALAGSALQLPAILVTPPFADHAGRPGGVAHRPLFLRSREATDIAAGRPCATLRPWKNASR